MTKCPKCGSEKTKITKTNHKGRATKVARRCGNCRHRWSETLAIKG